MQGKNSIDIEINGKVNDIQDLYELEQLLIRLKDLGINKKLLNKIVKNMFSVR